MAFTVLVVCTANVCRSAAAEALLADAAQRAGVDVVVSSAGAGGETQAYGLRRCDRMQDWLAHDVGVSVPDRLSRPLLVEDVLAADLVLTADRHHRGAAVRLAPRRRDRVFTLVEAAALAASPAAGLSAPGRAPTPDELRAAVAELDAARGDGAVPRGAALDLPDAHTEPVSHRTLLPRLVESVQQLTVVLLGSSST